MLVPESDHERIYGRPGGGTLRESGSGACGIYAPCCQIQGRFLFDAVSIDTDNDRVLLFSLLNAKVDVLDFDPHFSRPGRGRDSRARLDFNNCEYKEIAYLDVERAKAWLECLDRRYAPRSSGTAWTVWRQSAETILCAAVKHCAVASRLFPQLIETEIQVRKDTKEFTPQPYLQLANVVRAAGYDQAADKILLRLERNRTRWGNQGALRQIGGWLYDLAIKRGFAPFRPLLYLMALWVMTVCAFHAAGGNFVPAKDNRFAEEQNKTQLPCDELNKRALVGFSSWTYAFELVVPIITLEEKRNWVFNSPSHCNPPTTAPFVARMLVVLDPILGWIMTSFLVTGIAGLIRAPRG
jgi:hypothetical protein